MKHINRNPDGTWNDDDKALANACITLAEANLEVIGELRGVVENLGTVEKNLDRLVAQLKRVNEPKGYDPEMEDMDTWLDNAGSH